MSYIPALFIACYPAIFIYSRYSETVSAVKLAAALAVSVFFSLLLCGLAKLLYRRNTLADKRSGLAAAVLAIVAVSYGHLFNSFYIGSLNLLIDLGIANLPETTLKFGWKLIILAFFLCFTAWSYRRIRSWTDATIISLSKAVMIFSTFFILMPTLTIISSAGQTHEKKQQRHPNAVINTEDCEYCRSDIYHIVLDGYARQDILTQYYGFSNQDFLDQLEQLDFAVVKDARSNYAWTFLSLSSTLNMQYLDTLVDQNENSSRHCSQQAYKLIRENQVADIIKQFDYQYVHMNSTWGATLYNDHADISFDCKSSPLQDEFYRVLFEGSLLRIFSAQVIQDIASCHLNNFSWLTHDAPRIKGNNFVFAHFILPHHPYLFDKNGHILRHADLSDQFQFQKKLWGDRVGYLQQLQFVNKKVLEAVEQIIKSSEHPPIIIIQSDHGPQLIAKDGKRDINFDEGRSGILLAILEPDPKAEVPVKSSVNIFPYLLNTYFNQRYAIRPDKYFTSSHKSPCDVEEVTFSY
ncbi:MAG: hypothetical protein ACR2P1_23340 [Pseudomonadales bacterium]